MSIHNVFKVAWEKYESTSITNLKDNMILIEFENEEGKTTILDQLPWFIHGN